MTDWSDAALDRIEAAQELEIAAARSDDTVRRFLPIWVVRVGSEVYVRTWYRRDTGWFGQAVRSGRARIRVPDLDADVFVEDVGEGSAAVRDAVDAAYRAKYGGFGDESIGGMVSDTAAATTLHLRPVD